MSENKKIGTIGWIDLTVPDAAVIRDFYKSVIGWEHSPVSMGEYNDFCMLPPGSENPVSGICYARGTNKDLPPVWMIYIYVADIDISAASCKKYGGEIILGPKDFGGQGRYAIIKDPAGAYAALYQSLE